MDDIVPAILPNMTCPECTEAMRLVGIERDSQNPSAHLVTFECGAGHFAVIRLRGHSILEI